MRIQSRRRKKTKPTTQSHCPIRRVPGGQSHHHQRWAQSYAPAAAVVAPVVHEYARTFSRSHGAGVGRGLSFAGSVADRLGGGL